MSPFLCLSILLIPTLKTNASLNNADLDEVNLTAATLIDTDVTGASIIDINITNATIFNTGIAVGGSEE